MDTILINGLLGAIVIFGITLLYIIVIINKNNIRFLLKCIFTYLEKVSLKCLKSFIRYIKYRIKLFIFIFIFILFVLFISYSKYVNYFFNNPEKMILGIVSFLLLLLLIIIVLIQSSKHSNTLELLEYILYTFIYLLPIIISIKILYYNYQNSFSSFSDKESHIDLKLPKQVQAKKVSSILNNYVYKISNNVFWDFLLMLTILVVIVSIYKFVHGKDRDNNIFIDLYDFISIIIKECSDIIIKYVFDMIPIIIAVIAMSTSLSIAKVNVSIFYWLICPVPIVSSLIFIKISYDSKIPKYFANFIRFLYKKL